ncbi:MAG: hypothetical protein ABSF64_33110 [Bryobacteraceae bacterium]|jgi:hypothetical protein
MNAWARLAFAAVLVVPLLAPVGSAQTATLATLYSFKGQGGDGSQPYARLTVGPDARLYGTTAYGGTAGAGTVFD